MKKIAFLVTSLMLFTLLVVNGAMSQVKEKTSQLKQEQAMTAGDENVRIKKFDFAVQCWTFRKFSFFETLKKVNELGIKYVQAYPGQNLGDEMPGLKFDHNLDDAQIKQVQEKLKQHGIEVYGYGVVGFNNSAENMEKVFSFAQKMGIRTIITEPGFDDYALIEQMVQKYDINIAIHNHPVPSKYARPETVLEHVKGRDLRIGSCADTGHWMRSGVNPVAALRMLKGRIIDVHLKDLHEFGIKTAYDVPFGQGQANVHDILAELTRQNYPGFLAIEHENEKEIDNPSPSIKKGVEFIRSITYFQDYEEILARDNGWYSKHGWNHYGPGHFELDEKTGVLKSQGGMGLFWYSVKKYRDFILELDYKCSQVNTNSGIFVRVPEMPVNNDYIYHSFEVQIYDAGQGIHKTGAAYDAEPAKASPFKEPGDWNHYKITFKASRLQVELNDTLVLDWEAGPRGKVQDFATEGYIGLQNHDSISPVYFKNIFVRELK